MGSPNDKKRIAILGGGPASLFMYKRLVEAGRQDFTVDIFEAKSYLGAGMPYSTEGSGTEHITNVSGNEIPVFPVSIVDWVKALPQQKLAKYNIDRDTFHEFMVLPRLLFGEYLNVQFDLLLQSAAAADLTTIVHLNSPVTDIIDEQGKGKGKVFIEVAGLTKNEYDQVIICTGHNWPVKYERTVPGYFDSPYPPSKLQQHFNHPVAVRGSSLTAIDAVRTLARQHGIFVKETGNKLSFHLHKNFPDFKIIMHSRDGLLPGIRFHLDDPHLSNKSLLTEDEIDCHIKENGGFLSLDFIFEKDFKEPFREKDPSFYKLIKDMNMEEFVELMMGFRESIDPFVLFKKEYAEAQQSIRHHESVYWKEMLAVLSFAMNYPAKYFSAEDMQRLQQTLMPLISIVIAFVPQSSCDELIALHDAGLLELVKVGDDSKVEARAEGGIIYHFTNEKGLDQQAAYKTFVDCIGQPHLMLDDFPFKSLVESGSVSQARLKFRSADAAARSIEKSGKNICRINAKEFYLEVPGIAITDNFNVIGKTGEHNPRIHIMAVPYIGGFNPDYSGLDFCEEASGKIAEDLFSN